MQIGILEPHDFSDKAIEGLKTVGKVQLFDGRDQKAFIKDKNVLFIRLKHYIGKDFLEEAAQLKFICSPTTGLNHIDLDEAARKGVTVISLKGERELMDDIRATPEHTFGLLVALLRKYKDCFLGRHHVNWDREKYIGAEIYSNKFGIIGYGRIGRRLAEYLTAFGAEVSYFDNGDVESCRDGVRKADSIENLIKGANVIILSASYSQKNEGLMNRNYIDLMRDKYFINTSRGELVDEPYLIEKIRQDHFKGIALDVINKETGINNLEVLTELIEGRNFILTPHVGGATTESMQKTEEYIVEKFLEENIHEQN